VTELLAGLVLLRRPHPADADAVLAVALDLDVRQWNPRVRIANRVEAVAACEAPDAAIFSIVDRGIGRYAGTVSLHSIADGEAHVGYRTAPWIHGRGAATAAVAAITACGLVALGLDRILLTHAVENIDSCRMAEKCGFTLAGLRPKNKRFGDGRLHDEHLHTLAAPNVEPPR
jgi:RimJ/RimL family protein N-acetyltransferase